MSNTPIDTPKLSDIKIVEKDWMPEGKFALVSSPNPAPTDTDDIDSFVRDLTKVHPIAKSEVRKRLTEYIANQVKQARIDELRRAVSDTPKEAVYDTITKKSISWWNVSEKYVTDRIKELEQ